MRADEPTGGPEYLTRSLVARPCSARADGVFVNNEGAPRRSRVCADGPFMSKYVYELLPNVPCRDRMVRTESVHPLLVHQSSAARLDTSPCGRAQKINDVEVSLPRARGCAGDGLPQRPLGHGHSRVRADAPIRLIERHDQAPSLPRARGCAGTDDPVSEARESHSRVRADAPSHAALATLDCRHSRVRADAPIDQNLLVLLDQVTPACARMRRKEMVTSPSCCRSLPRARGCAGLRGVSRDRRQVTPACARMTRERPTPDPSLPGHYRVRADAPDQDATAMRAALSGLRARMRRTTPKRLAAGSLPRACGCSGVSSPQRATSASAPRTARTRTGRRSRSCRRRST